GGRWRDDAVARDAHLPRHPRERVGDENGGRSSTAAGDVLPVGADQAPGRTDGCARRGGDPRGRTGRPRPSRRHHLERWECRYLADRSLGGYGKGWLTFGHWRWGSTPSAFLRPSTLLRAW